MSRKPYVLYFLIIAQISTIICSSYLHLNDNGLWNVKTYFTQIWNFFTFNLTIVESFIWPGDNDYFSSSKDMSESQPTFSWFILVYLCQAKVPYQPQGNIPSWHHSPTRITINTPWTHLMESFFLEFKVPINHYKIILNLSQDYLCFGVRHSNNPKLTNRKTNRIYFLNFFPVSKKFIIINHCIRTLSTVKEQKIKTNIRLWPLGNSRSSLIAKTYMIFMSIL